jgi:hypothetical protein
MLQPTWQAPEGGNLANPTGTNVTWVAPSGGQYHVVLVVSDGDRRFGQQIVVEVRQGESPSPTVIETFAPESETPTAPPEESTPTDTPEPGLVFVEVGKVAEGDDADNEYTNDEHITAGSDVTYLITIDNDTNGPVTITSLVDDLYPEAVCLTAGDAPVIQTVLSSDDGDGPGNIDGGSDQVQCTFTVTVNGNSGDVIVNTATGVVEDLSGSTDADQDNTTVTIN